MKKILGFGLILMSTAVFIGCTSTTDNTNLRNANTNTGYMASNVNSATPLPAYTPAAVNNSMTNVNTKPTMNSNMKPVSNANMKPAPNTKSNSTMGSNTKVNKNGY